MTSFGGQSLHFAAPIHIWRRTYAVVLLFKTPSCQPQLSSEWYCTVLACLTDFQSFADKMAISILNSKLMLRWDSPFKEREFHCLFWTIAITEGGRTLHIRPGYRAESARSPRDIPAECSTGLRAVSARRPRGTSAIFLTENRWYEQHSGMAATSWILPMTML